MDSRGEIAACSNGVPQNDLGYADILDGWKKSDGMMNAIRTMGPEIIVCDEIGDQDVYKRQSVDRMVYNSP